MKRIFLPLFSLLLIAACSPSKYISRSAEQDMLQDSAMRTAHVGISVFEPATGRYWYNYQGDKYFVPASNTKLPTCYAAMKFLGDSLVAAKYRVNGDEIVFEAAGDPSFLHPDFPRQPFYQFLKRFRTIRISSNFQAEPLGSGWAWNDYNAAYMAERDPFPVYGNIARFYFRDTLSVVPRIFNANVIGEPFKNKPWSVERVLGTNEYLIDNERGTTAPVKEVPMAMEKGLYASALLSDTLHKAVDNGPYPLEGILRKFYSQPTDSFLKITMHRSDNFFAEQALLMVSNELLGRMNDSRIRDTLLKSVFSDLPQKPRWADGSGLSRYNLFTPQDFVAILNKMKNEFGMDRIREILPTGNEGTLNNFYKNESGYIFAKTGTLSGVVALSGFLYTKQNKLLIFSVLVNNHQASSSTAVRRAVEKFIVGIREKF